MIYHLLALIICTIWGITLVSTKILLQAGLSPEMIFTLRFTLAYIAMLACSHKRLWANNWKDELYLVGIGVAGGSIFYFAENTSLIYTQSSTCSFITAMPPLFLALYAVARRRMRSSWNLWLGLALALSGLYGVIADVGNKGASNPLLGNAIAFAACFLWCIYTLLTLKVSHKYSSGFITRKMFFYGTISSIPFIYSEIPSLPTILPQPTVIGNLLFLALLASWFNYYAWNIVISKLGDFQSSNYLYTIPLATCIFSWLVLNEPLTPIMMLGALGIISGLFISMNSPERLKKIWDFIKP